MQQCQWIYKDNNSEEQDDLHAHSQVNPQNIDLRRQLNTTANILLLVGVSLTDSDGYNKLVKYLPLIPGWNDMR